MIDKDIQKLEEALGKKFEDWTEETILEMVSNEEVLKLFTQDVAINLITNRKNSILTDILTPIKFGHYYHRTRDAIEKELADFVENKRDVAVFKENLLKIPTNDPISKMLMYLTVLSTIQNQDIFTEEDIKNTIKDYKEILLSIDIEQAFELIINLVDVLFPLREIYFQLYNVDILGKDSDIEGLLSKLDEKISKLAELKKQQEGEATPPLDNGDKQ